MNYYNIPISAEGINDDHIESFDKIINSIPKPVLIHCAVAGRVGTLWAMHRISKQNIKPEAAIEEALAIGMHLPMADMIRNRFK